MVRIWYNRAAVIEYAVQWAYGRNPSFYDFSQLGGDCTNFASQCLYAGIGVMNYMPIDGWYYITASDRAPSWTGVEFFYRFLIENQGQGPYGYQVSSQQAELGDFVQLIDTEGDPYHTLVVLETYPELLVAAHSQDSLYRPLASYDFASARFLHILGGRV